MKDALSYFQLRAFLYEREKEQMVSFKLQELVNVWFCTPKNCKRRLKKYELEGFYTYEPGKGRGHSSHLIFNQSFHLEVQKMIQKFIEKEELDAILQLMELPIPKSWFSNFRSNFEQLFGFHTDNQNKETLRTVIKRNITTLDPRYASVTFECSLLRQLGDTLVIYDRETDSILPHLAHHWIVNEQHTIWKFYLRKGILFHDQRIMTSSDVLHTFQQFQDLSCPFYWLVEDIEKMECSSDYIITFYLNRPNSFFLRFICSENLSILPKDVPFNENHWIGSGPFMLKERSDNKLLLEANNHYFMERPLIDEIEFWRVPEETFREETYELSNQEGISHAVNKQILEPGFRFLIFNFTKPSVVHQLAFRKAIYHIVDIKKMWSDLGRDNLVEASSYFPWKSKPQIKDPSKVQTLLEKSGYKGETLTIMVPNGQRAKEEMKWVISEAASYGVQLRIKYFAMESFYSINIEEIADFVFMGEVSSLDPHLSFLGAFKNRILLFRRFWSKSHLQYIDERLEHFKNKETAEQREQTIEEIENYIKEKHLLIFTIHPIRNRTFHSMIRNIQFDSYGYVDFRKLWIQ